MAYKKDNTSDGRTAEDRALDRFAEMMIEKISSIQQDWRKPWFTEGTTAWPKNLSGREYNGMNALMLMLHSEKSGYKLPVFCTFNRVAGLNFSKDKAGNSKPLLDDKGEKLPQVTILKGEKSFPVFLTTFTVVNKETREKIKIEDYRKLSEKEKKQYNVYPKQNVYNVFNVSQTNLQEARPELYAKLEAENGLVRPTSKEGEEFTFPAMDCMIEQNQWLCPIYPRHQDEAYYSITKDHIVVPEKSQFRNGENFYGTLLHEMTHSTGAEGRLDRLKPGGTFGSADYAREELVAELGSALTASRYGINKHVKEDSAAYLKSWLDSLKESPEFIKTTLFDVKRASSMITQRVDAIQDRIDKGLNPVLEEEQMENATQVSGMQKEKPYYASVQYLQFETEQMDKLLNDKDFDGILREAKEYDNGDAIDLEHTFKSPTQNRGDDMLTEDDDYAVVYNNSVGGTYEIFRKVTEQEVKDSINRYGLPDNVSDDVKNVARDMVETEFTNMTQHRTPAFEMPDGDILYAQYNKDHDSIDVGTVTNAGLAVKHSFTYDYDRSLDENLQDTAGQLNEMEEYQLEEMHYHRGR